MVAFCTGAPLAIAKSAATSEVVNCTGPVTCRQCYIRIWPLPSSETPPVWYSSPLKLLCNGAIYMCLWLWLWLSSNHSATDYTYLPTWRVPTCDWDIFPVTLPTVSKCRRKDRAKISANRRKNMLFDNLFRSTSLSRPN